MIILDERQFINKELELRGFDIFDFYENHQIMDMSSFCSIDLKRRGEFLLVDTQTVLLHPELLENFKSVLNTFVGAIFFQESTNQKAQKWIQDEGILVTKIIGEYSLPMPQLNWTILSNQMAFLWGLIEDQKNLQKQLALFSTELDEFLQTADQEMTKVKKIHEAILPRRINKIKGITFTNKYSVGEGGGSEIYDLRQTQNKVFQIFVSSESYLVSSAILGILSQQNEKDFDPSIFLSEAMNEYRVIGQAKKKKPAIDILVLELDFLSLNLRVWSDSKAELYSLIRGRLDIKKDEDCLLSRDEKVVVFSPGFIFNWNESYSGVDINSFLEDHKKVTTNELMSELFFSLKNRKEGQFLKKDSIIAVMEVNRHGFHKV